MHVRHIRRVCFDTRYEYDVKLYAKYKDELIAHDWEIIESTNEIIAEKGFLIPYDDETMKAFLGILEE